MIFSFLCLVIPRGSCVSRVPTTISYIFLTSLEVLHVPPIFLSVLREFIILTILTVLKEAKRGNCTVTMTGVRITMVSVGKQWVLNILSEGLYSCLIYSACQEHAPYYIATCGLSDCNIFFNIVSQMARFWRGVVGSYLLDIKCVLHNYCSNKMH
jgi:hypothetical protein